MRILTFICRWRGSHWWVRDPDNAARLRCWTCGGWTVATRHPAAPWREASYDE